MGKSITVAAPGAANMQFAEPTLDEIKKMSFQEQSQVMCDLAYSNFPLTTSTGVSDESTYRTISALQEFQLKSFADQVQHMSREQAQEFLIMVHRQMIIQEKMYPDFIDHEWNLKLRICVD